MIRSFALHPDLSPALASFIMALLHDLVVAGTLSISMGRLTSFRGTALRELQASAWGSGMDSGMDPGGNMSDMTTMPPWSWPGMDMGMENMSNMTTMPPTMYSPDMGCGNDQTCFAFQYNNDGTSATDDMGMPLMNMTCVPWSSGCPCNPMWEVSCSVYGYTFCQPLNKGSCPVSCGSNATCYSWNGTQSCGTGANGMSCVGPRVRTVGNAGVGPRRSASLETSHSQILHRILFHVLWGFSQELF